MVVTEQAALSFGGLLRQLRAGAGLTQEELAEAARLSPRAVSALERGVNRTARKDTAELLAGALGLAGPARELFVAAARGKAPAGHVLAAVHEAQPQPQGAVTPSPYRGLAAFEEQDAAFFFGREAATTELLERMSGHLQGAGLLIVSGASGAGKSSLLQAGVLARIRGAGLADAPGSAQWPCLVFTPTRAPLDELALRVAVLAGADAAAVRRGLDADPDGFALTARQAALAASPGPGVLAAGQRQPRSQPRLLLVVDQFEQVFTQCPDEVQRRAFIAALHAAGSVRHGPDDAPAALVVLGVRADFEVRCAEYPQLAGAVQDRYLVMAMTERQLRMAITEPAKKAGSRVDDDLVSCERGPFTWAALREYLVSGLGPGEGVAAVVPAVNEVLDGGDEVLDRGEAAAADGLPGDDGEEDLNEVEPGPGRGREVQGDPGVPGQPGPHVGVGVGAVVVADDVQRHPRVGLGDLFEEGQELLVAVLGVAGAGHLAGGGLQRGDGARESAHQRANRRQARQATRSCDRRYRTCHRNPRMTFARTGEFPAPFRCRRFRRTAPFIEPGT